MSTRLPAAVTVMTSAAVSTVLTSGCRVGGAVAATSLVISGGNTPTAPTVAGVALAGTSGSAAAAAQPVSRSAPSAPTNSRRISIFPLEPLIRLDASHPCRLLFSSSRISVRRSLVDGLSEVRPRPERRYTLMIRKTTNAVAMKVTTWFRNAP